MKIVVLGGYGSVGKHLCVLLAQNPEITLVIVGRDYDKASLLVDVVQKKSGARVIASAMDWEQEDFSQKLKEHQPDILIHMADSFTESTAIVAKTCIEAGVHYIDIADDSAFLAQVVACDQQAREKSVCVITGAGMVPGLSSAIFDEYAPQFSVCREVECGVVYGNKMALGRSRWVRFLAQAGKSFVQLKNGKWGAAIGWLGGERYYYGDNIGLCWHANFNAPDVTLLPKHYPSLQSALFFMGLESAFLRFLLVTIAWLTKKRLIKKPQCALTLLMALNRWRSQYGRNTTAMFMRFSGSNHQYLPLEIQWRLVAEEGDGVYLPLVGVLLLIKKIQEKSLPVGAQHCIGLFTLKECYEVLFQWRMYHIVEEFY